MGAKETMEQLRKFLRGKGFALALAACLLAAAVAGVWAVRTVRAELEKSIERLDTPGSSAARKQTESPKEDDPWQQQTEPAAHSVSNVPKSASSAPPASSSSASLAGPGSGSVYEPSELRVGSAPASSSAAPASAQPVSGRVLNAYSGDELVYNETLGDWRTHNGVDYAAKQGESVSAPAAGTVVEVGTDDSFGPVVAVEDSAGRVWRLCGVASPAVKKGDTVKVGQAIGKVGSVSCECAEESHIHVEVKQGEKYLDPAELIR